MTTLLTFAITICDPGDCSTRSTAAITSGSTVVQLGPTPTLLLGAFLARYALSPVGRRYILARAKTTTMTTISQGDLESMPVPSPDLDTQRRIADQLDAIDATIDRIRTRQTHLRAFGASLLNSIWPA